MKNPQDKIYNVLTLVGLSIGNIEDVTLRALKALFLSEYIAAEDTRNYLKIKSILKERYSDLLKSLEVNINNKPVLISYREQNHKTASNNIIKLIKQGKQVCLISDAGMPSISDPGFRLVDAVLKANLEVDVIPGATAVDSALVISGLPTDYFSFLGFLPRQEGKIKKLLANYLELDTTIIIYESPYRLVKTLEIVGKNFENIKTVVCNDLTKKFQKVIRGNTLEVLHELKSIKIQGEWVILLRKVN